VHLVKPKLLAERYWVRFSPQLLLSFKELNISDYEFLLARYVDLFLCLFDET
jgi:hypothetical protein